MYKNNNAITVDELYAPVLIVGTGIGGLVTAYYLSRNNIDYIIVTKGQNPKSGNTILAPGNTRIPHSNEIDSLVDLSVEQCGSPRYLLNEIYKHSDFIKNFYENIDLKYKKTVFGIIPTNSKYKLGGRAVVESLLPRITKPVTCKYLLQIKKIDNYICSYFYDYNTDMITRIISYSLVLATGGYGSLFSYNDNHISATGEGILIAKEAGARLKGMSTVMYHPWSVSNGKRILVGDIVSLSGGNVIDNNGTQLIKDQYLVELIKYNMYHNRFQDILKEEFKIIKEGNEIFLDLRCTAKKQMSDLLKLYGYRAELLHNGLIKVFPTVHYTSGGIEVDKNCEAKGFKNLFVTGEAQFNGDKGCGRLPGQAFTASIVCGEIISNAIIAKRFETFHAPERINTFDLPKLFIRFYSKKNYNIDSVRKHQKQLGRLLTRLTSKMFSSRSFFDMKEELNTLESTLFHMKGCRKCFLKILKVYFTCGIVKEIINDVQQYNHI